MSNDGNIFSLFSERNNFVASQRSIDIQPFPAILFTKQTQLGRWQAVGVDLTIIFFDYFN